MKLRSARTVLPYIKTADVEIRAPGGSSMNGMNLSGKPGIVQPMHTPATFGHRPMPFIQPRLGTLHRTTGKQLLQPHVIDLNDVVGSMQKMRRRLIGEHIDLRITGLLIQGAAFLHKPVTAVTLANKVREQLDAR